MLQPHLSDKQVEAGCDEAGRGCLAGPVVAAAVIFPKGYRHHNLNDSKQLNARARETLRKDIERDALAWGIGVVSNEDIDKMNILKASFVAMHRAIDRLSACPELLLIDGNRFAPYRDIPFRCVVRGDATYASVAAASILAKTYRDAQMKAWAKKYAGYGWEHNMGYPTPQHRRAIRQRGITPLHRLSFKPVLQATKRSSAT